MGVRLSEVERPAPIALVESHRFGHASYLNAIQRLVVGVESDDIQEIEAVNVQRKNLVLEDGKLCSYQHL